MNLEDKSNSDLKFDIASITVWEWEYLKFLLLKQNFVMSFLISSKATSEFRDKGWVLELCFYKYFAVSMETLENQL